MSLTPPDVEPVQLRQLDVSSVRANARNPRLEFPQSELDKLAESIELEGILVPIVVFPKDGLFVLVDGERRFRCAQILGLETVPALITPERSEHDVLVQMFNIHMVREPWKDMPTAKALVALANQIETDSGGEVSDATLRDVTGMSVDRIKQLRYVMTLPGEWQTYISEGRIPLNFFWELKRNILDLLESKRPALYAELGGWQEIGQAFVSKRIDGVISDTVGLRKVRPLINFAASEAQGNEANTSFLDENLRDLVTNEDLTIDEVYEDTVQVMVEVDKLERRTRSMVATFDRLLGRANGPGERSHLYEVGNGLTQELNALFQRYQAEDE